MQAAKIPQLVNPQTGISRVALGRGGRCRAITIAAAVQRIELGAEPSNLINRWVTFQLFAAAGAYAEMGFFFYPPGSTAVPATPDPDLAARITDPSPGLFDQQCDVITTLDGRVRFFLDPVNSQLALIGDATASVLRIVDAQT